jgi:hypothetical protein
MRTVYASQGSWTLKSALPIAVIALMGLSACAEADSQDAPEGEKVTRESKTRVVPTGTSIVFVVDRAVSTETDHQGDQFTATLRSSIMGSEGGVVIPEGSQSTWVVTESSTSDGQSVLAFRLESVGVDGERLPVTATVTEATLDTDHPDSNSETAAKIGVGAAAGAIVGQILGHDTEAVRSVRDAW